MTPPTRTAVAPQAAPSLPRQPAAGGPQTTGPSDSRWVLASLALSMLLSSLGTSIVNVGLPTLAQSLGVSFQEVQWVVLAYLLAITTAVVSVGRLGDLVGRRRLLLAGLALFTGASALCAAAPTLGLLVAARALQGLGAAAMMALTMAFVGETVSRDRVGSAMGLLGTLSAVGTALGPTLGGVLIAQAGWPMIFLINLPLGVLGLLLVRCHLPADRQAAGDRPGFDPLGTVLLALALAAYALAMTMGRGGWGLLNGALLCLAALGACLFVWAQARVAAPLVRLSVLRLPGLGAGLVTSTLVATVVMATLVVGPFHLSGALGLGAAQVGLAMSCGPLVSALAGLPAGRAVDRLGAHAMGLAGLAAMLAGCAGLALAPLAWGVPGYVVPLAVLTAGYALFQAANNTAVMVHAEPGARGAVAGLLNLSRNLGLITGASAMGAVFAMGAVLAPAVGAPGMPVVAGMRATFMAAALLMVGAMAFVLCSHARRRQGCPPGIG